jgi:hypothetical protein
MTRTRRGRRQAAVALLLAAKGAVVACRRAWAWAASPWTDGRGLRAL